MGNTCMYGVNTLIFDNKKYNGGRVYSNIEILLPMDRLVDPLNKLRMI